MNVSLRKIEYVFFQLFLALITIVYINFITVRYNNDFFRKLCIFATMMSLLILVVQVKYEKGFIKPFVIVLVCFELFQIGLPMLYAIDKTYTNWNMEFFDLKNRIESLTFTLYCIHAFAIGGCIGITGEKKKKDIGKKFLENPNLNRKIAMILSIATGIVAIPLAAMITALSMKYGYNYIKVDSMGINSGFTNAVRTIFPASIFLLLVYSKSKIEKKIVLTIIVIYGSLSMAAGGRTVGLSIFLVLIYYYTTNGEKKQKNKLLRIIVTAMLIMALITVLVFVRNMRMGEDMSKFNIITIVESVIEEMGFNFTSICFTKKYIPQFMDYSMGKSYINAIVCLIPSSLDPMGIVDACKQASPEQWLAVQLHRSYGTTFDYGVGYSVVAESFYNFGNFGYFIVFIQGYFIQRILSIDFVGNSKFSLYIKLIMIWALTTYPRRSFYTLEKALEYDVLLVMLTIWIVYSIARRRRK